MYKNAQNMTQARDQNSKSDRLEKSLCKKRRAYAKIGPPETCNGCRNSFFSGSNLSIASV